MEEFKLGNVRLESEAYTCCFCGYTYFDHGNNASPLFKNGEKCCDSCNGEYVIRARLLKKWGLKKVRWDDFKKEVVFG